MAIVTNARLTVEIDGEEYKVLITRLPKVKEKELTQKIEDASAPLKELGEKAQKATELQETLRLTLAAAEGAPIGLEKVGLYKDALAVRAKIALAADVNTQYVEAAKTFEDELEKFAKQRFDIVVVDGKEALQKTLEAKNITYVEILGEINKAFDEAAKKKSQTSDAGQKREQSGERSGEA